MEGVPAVVQELGWLQLVVGCEGTGDIVSVVVLVPTGRPEDMGW